MTDSYLDRPQDDETPNAHPAYNRGKSKGVEIMISVVRNVLTGKDTGAGGSFNASEIENVRRALIVLVSSTKASGSKVVKDALEDAIKLVEK